MTGNNHKNGQEDRRQDDLLSIALRYVLEELSAEERAEFECRLLEQQAAREAVAEGVALCQSAKQAVDCVMHDAASVVNWRPTAGVEPLQPASQLDRAWRIPAAWAAMAVAASIMLAVVFTGIRGRSQLGHKPIGAGSPDMVTVDAGSSESTANGHADRGKQLAVAWVRFLPSPTEAALAADSIDADVADGEADSLGTDDDGNGDSGLLAGDEDIIARADSATAASDWVFQAVTAEPSSTPPTNSQEG